MESISNRRKNIKNEHRVRKLKKIIENKEKANYPFHQTSNTQQVSIRNRTTPHLYTDYFTPKPKSPQELEWSAPRSDSVAFWRL